MKRALAICSLGVAAIAALIGFAFYALESTGQFSPTKCAELGGEWDSGVELCHLDE